MRHLLFRGLAMGIGVLTGLATGPLLAEGVVRLMLPAANAVRPQRLQRGPKGGRYQADPQLAYRPRFGKRFAHSHRGTLHNRYPLRKASGKRRVLFVGDSVTRRGRLVRALRERYGEKRYEYWNAGVEGYTPYQELVYYRRYLRHLDADHVVLSLHNNDLLVTPVLVTVEGRLLQVHPGHPITELNLVLFRHSQLYRFLVHRHYWHTRRRGQSDYLRGVADVRRSLRRLKRLLADDNTRLSVVLFPMLLPWKRWSEDHKVARWRLLQLLRALELRHFDLLAPLQEALAHGIPCGQTPGDDAHPSIAAARYFARHLQERGLLQ